MRKLNTGQQWRTHVKDRHKLDWRLSDDKERRWKVILIWWEAFTTSTEDLNIDGKEKERRFGPLWVHRCILRHHSPPLSSPIYLGGKEVKSLSNFRCAKTVSSLSLWCSSIVTDNASYLTVGMWTVMSGMLTLSIMPFCLSIWLRHLSSDCIPYCTVPFCGHHKAVNSMIGIDGTEGWFVMLMSFSEM